MTGPRELLCLALLAGCQVDSQVGSNRIALGDAAPPPDAEPLPACRDGEDNDGDDLVDHPFDPGCDELADLDERDPAVPPVCANRDDDDGDQIIDFPLEPGCTSAADGDETDPVPPAQCSDGLDNDDSGAMDYPADPGCDGAGDLTESTVTS
jgi:hypothetical protein